MSISLVIFSCVHFVLFPFPFQTPVGITALRCLPSECAGDGVLLTETFYNTAGSEDCVGGLAVLCH